MAEFNHTSEPSSAKVKYPATRQLTVLETICENAAKTRGVGLNYVPVTLRLKRQVARTGRFHCRTKGRGNRQSR